MKKHVAYELEADDLEAILSPTTGGQLELDVEDADTVEVFTRAVPDVEQPADGVRFTDRGDKFDVRGVGE